MCGFFVRSVQHVIMSGWAGQPLKRLAGRESGMPTPFSPAPMFGIMLPG